VLGEIHNIWVTGRLETLTLVVGDKVYVRNRMTMHASDITCIKKNFLVTFIDSEIVSLLVDWLKLRIAINLNKYKELFFAIGFIHHYENMCIIKSNHVLISK
jgi:hypothetical protein